MCNLPQMTEIALLNKRDNVEFPLSQIIAALGLSLTH